MGLFHKKDDIPKIPSAPTLPKLPEIKVEEKTKRNLPELPSFPANSRNENFNQEIVKSAITDMPSPGEEEVHVEVPTGLHVVEEPERKTTIPPRPSMEKSIQEPPARPIVKEISEDKNEITSLISKGPIIKEIEPIFVRIDKFQKAQEDFSQIKDKVKEIEGVLKKIKDVKLKEEVELKGWTEDIEKIKLRLGEVDADIFNQI